MESLVRTAVGPFRQAAALPLAAVTPDAVRQALQPALNAVPHLPRHALDAGDVAHAVSGGLLDLGAGAAESIAALDDAGELVGVLRRHDSGRHRLRPNFRGAG
jgi:hypothetical protein